MLLAIVSGAIAFSTRLRLYTIATILVFVVGSIFGVWGRSRAKANLPTPWAGMTERMKSYGYLLWVAVLAITLLRTQVPRPKPCSSRRPRA
jgi:hypothetical protein